jgi:hypothetical protein
LRRETRVLCIGGEILGKLMKQKSKVGIQIMERVAEIYFKEHRSIVNKAVISL